MNKLDECYVVSQKIIDKYIQLLCMPIYIVSNNMKEDKLSEIKALVDEEYKIIHSMTNIDITLCLEKINNNDGQYDQTVLTRIKNRIEDYSEVLKGTYVKSGEIGIKNIPHDKVSSSYEVILSMFNIEIIKNMKNKIYSLTPNCDSDKSFKNKLSKQLDISKITFLFGSPTSELIALYNSIDIEKIPNIDKNKFRHKMVGNISFNVVITTTAAIYSKKTLDILSNISIVNNNPSDVFYYLSLITKLEVLISYLDKNTLNTIYNYCKSNISDHNKSNMEYVKRLIKEKIERNS